MEVDNNLCFQAPDFFLKTDIIFKFLLPLQTLLLFFFWKVVLLKRTLWGYSIAQVYKLISQNETYL